MRWWSAASLTISLLASCIGASVAAQPTQSLSSSSSQFRDDALAFAELVNREYAYLDRLSGGRFELTPALAREAADVTDRRTLLKFLERALLLLGDHHAITGSSLPDSWAVVPSYSDMWIEKTPRGYLVAAMRAGTPAQARGVVRGSYVTAVAGVATDTAVARFAGSLGITRTAERDAFLARILIAGRRDRPRHLTLRLAEGERLDLNLPSLYQQAGPAAPPVTLQLHGGSATISINDALGDTATIVAFDQAMRAVPRDLPLNIDLINTPSGGNTTVARAIMSWFADRATPYQRHDLPSEERQTGIARAWLELVLPRASGRHGGPVSVRVGRWTGSMGEGLAIGLQALGARLCGDKMAGLLGAVADFEVGRSGLTVKLPFERLSTVDGTPREAVEPAPCEMSLAI